MTHLSLSNWYSHISLLKSVYVAIIIFRSYFPSQFINIVCHLYVNNNILLYKRICWIIAWRQQVNCLWAPTSHNYVVFILVLHHKTTLYVSHHILRRTFLQRIHLMNYLYAESDLAHFMEVLLQSYSSWINECSENLLSWLSTERCLHEAISEVRNNDMKLVSFLIRTLWFSVLLNTFRGLRFLGNFIL